MKTFRQFLFLVLVSLCLNSRAQVGIGTVSFVPANTLDVKGKMAIGTYAGVSIPDTSNSLIVSGNVGIGTTSAATYALTIASSTTSHIGFYYLSAGVPTLNSSIYVSGSELIVRHTNVALDNGAYFSHLKFGTTYGQDAFRIASNNSESVITNGRAINICAGESSPHTSSSTPILILNDNNSRSVGLGVVPTSQLDILGPTGYSQLRLRTPYTPSSSADTNGNIGDIAWDDNYFYMKVNNTGTNWVRSPLTSF